MKTQIHNIFSKYHVFITMGITCLVILIIGYGEIRHFNLEKQISQQNEQLASTTVAIDSQIRAINDQINNIVEENNLLNDVVQTEISNSSILADQLDQVNNTAETLDKLSKVDFQLLQKYSKIYFLNENYDPSPLVSLPSRYRYDKSVTYDVLDGVISHLEQMLDDASAEGINIKVISAYRSFGTQALLKSSYAVTYGAGTANQFSADQGYSEHQLGTTVDLTTPETKTDFSLFDQTDAYTWLKKNAYKYGFILSYPQNNSYYTYEPWHWRFVGGDLANKLHRQNKNFYDLDQKVINNYLSLFFD